MAKKSQKIETEPTPTPDVTKIEVDPVGAQSDADHIILLTSRVKKLSPKSDSYIQYELAETSEGKRYLRLSGNDSGGLFSREWLALDEVLVLLEETMGKPFKSRLLKSLFKGGSSNNAGFLAAVLRDTGLLIASGTTIFIHETSPDFVDKKNHLLTLRA